MFGTTVLMPSLMGFDVNTTLFFSGIGTVVFYGMTNGRVPSYLGASAAFLGPVISITGYKPDFFGQLNDERSRAQGGILVVGLVYAAVGLLVTLLGTKWLRIAIPPLVSGSVVMAIGLNLSNIGISSASSSIDAPWQATITVLLVGLFSCFGPDLTRRTAIMAGMVTAYAISAIAGQCVGRPLDYASLSQVGWVGPPQFVAPSFDGAAVGAILPAVIILLAENMGHIGAIGAIAGVDLEPYLGRAFMGDAVATIISAVGGGTGVTTYAENIGVIAVTKVYSTLLFIVAAAFAVVLSFIPKFGAAIRTIPNGVSGGLSIVLFGLISVTGARIWKENRVDLAEPANLFIAAVTVTIGAGMPSLPGGKINFSSGFALDGIGVATIVCLVLHFAIVVVPDIISGKHRERKRLGGKNESQSTL
ncbi:hypothetical protein HK101_003476 [Irineochytrium annulatum]|nr:hypothetical protein HK101_003476 [Irineochytrium annulatum]